MLAIDRRMHEIFNYCFAQALRTPDILKRRKTQRDSGAVIKNTNWKVIEQGIRNLEKSPELAGKYCQEKGLYTKGCLANALNLIVKEISTIKAITEYLNEHLELNAAKPRDKYSLREWMIKLKITP
jgi:hypothetical protein